MTTEKQTKSNLVQHWLGEISAARKREKDWRKDGKRILDIYNGKKKDQIPFNILYSNTETLLPALYNSQPRPVVQRRFKDEDPLGKVAAQAGVRTLEFLVDTNSADYASFDDVVTCAVLDGLLPGRGSSRIKYDAKIIGEAPARRVQWEVVCYESLKWDRWTHGYAKNWKRVPWVAFEYDVTVEEAEELFGREKANKLTFTEQAHLPDSEDNDQRVEDERTDEDIKVAKVWEVWHKTKKKVFFVSPNYDEGFLKEEDDPLGLSGFFPMPEPLRFLKKSNDLMPTALYTLYENQAKELNRLSVRINRVAEAIKVRGAYDQTITELDDLLKKDDNTMVGAQNVAALQTSKGLEGAIWLMPVDKLITVLQQLYIARNNCKQVIYEITGISDILRGQSVASETATAQEIKSQWGTLRLKRLQKEVQRYARDMLRITLEIAAKRFQEQTFVGMTGLPFATTQEVQAAQGQIAAAKSQIAMQTGQVPQDQQVAQLVPQAAQVLAKPHWQAVMQTLRGDTQRMYRIDIETNSTVDLEATEDQKLMSEVLTAISQFLSGVAPLIATGSMPFEVAQSMLLGIVRRYRFGAEIEDYIKAMKPPQNPEDGKNKMEAEKHQREMQKMDQELANEKEIKMLELAFKKEELRLKKELMVAQHQAKLAELALKKQQMELQARSEAQMAEIRVAEAHAMPKDKGPAGNKQKKGDRNAAS